MSPLATTRTTRCRKTFTGENHHSALSRRLPEPQPMDTKPTPAASLEDRLHDEMIDAVDEELELEIDDTRLEGLLADAGQKPQDRLDRHTYFTELLRLQKELIKLQDWVAYQKLKLVVLFEGRDAAGKGRVIKRA